MSEHTNDNTCLPNFFVTSMQDDGNCSPRMVVSEVLTNESDLSELQPDMSMDGEKPSEFPSTATESVTSFQDGQEVQLDDGSTAYLFHDLKYASDNGALEFVQQIQLDNGTTACLYQPKNDTLDRLLDTGVDESNSVLHLQVPFNLPSADERIGTKVFRCDHVDCSKVYTTAHHLKVHKRTHTGEKPYICKWTDCKKVFTTSYALKSHYRVHTGEKPYSCPDASCSKAFKTSGDLQKHIRTHTGERPFKCPFEGCGKAFTTSNICKVHIRTHTGERPHKCPYSECSKSFTNITNYKNHLRIHTGEKPYVCMVENCGKQFTEYSSLYKHQVVHCIRKPYMCRYCGKLYRQPTALSLHLQKVHPDCADRPESSVVNKDELVLPCDTIGEEVSIEQQVEPSTSSVVVESIEDLTPSCLTSMSNQQSSPVTHHSRSGSSSLEVVRETTSIPDTAQVCEIVADSSDVLDFASHASVQDGTIFINKHTTSLGRTSTDPSHGTKSSDGTETLLSNHTDSSSADNLSFATFELNGSKFIVRMVGAGNEVDDKDKSGSSLINARQSEDIVTLGFCEGSAHTIDSTAELKSHNEALVDSESFFVTEKSPATNVSSSANALSTSVALTEAEGSGSSQPQSFLVNSAPQSTTSASQAAAGLSRPKVSLPRNQPSLAPLLKKRVIVTIPVKSPSKKAKTRILAPKITPVSCDMDL